jgi:glycosyltransferase involved in cell wall biosynthesis
VGSGPDPGPEPSRILFFSDAPYEGGAERYIEYLAAGLPEEWSLTVVARARSSLDRWLRRLEGIGVRVWRTADSDLGLMRGLWRAVRCQRPDVVHLNLPHSYSAEYSMAAPVARLAGARAVVTTEHLTMIEPMRLRGRLRRLMSRGVDRIITLTESNRRDLTDRHGLPDDPIRVVFNGVPEPRPVSSEERAATRQALGAGEGEVLLVHVGALTARKGQRDLFEALAELSDPRWRLALVGEGEDEAALRRLATELDLTDRVTFGGRHEDVAPVLAAADVLVLPSHLEGMPLTLLEALAVGRAAVTTDIYGVPEIYADRKAALLVSPGDRTALREAIGRLVTDDGLRQEMGREANRLYAERFTVAHMVGETMQVYAEVMA